MMPVLLNPVQPFPNPDIPSTAKQVVSSQNTGKLSRDESPEAKEKKRYEDFRSRIDICKIYRRKLIANWTVNVDYRRGKPFTSQTDDDQVAVNLDWSLTKAKQAALFSQVPQVRIDHVPDTLPKNAPWAIQLEHQLNDTLVEAGIEAAMDECLPDCINAAGLGIVLVSYDALTEDRQVPKMDISSLPPEQQDEFTQSGTVQGTFLPMDTIPYALDHRYTIQRVSPGDFLWPINYTGSNFDKAPWLGRSGRVTWAEALQLFAKTDANPNGLTEDDHDTVIGEDRPILDRLTHDVERDKTSADEMVGFDELFYHENTYDVEAKSYNTIHHMVYVAGKEKPVIDEPWKGQKVNPQDHSVIGTLKYPLRVLTLTYISDETIPPSDSAIGRPQVNEINKARTQMIRQRERSLPVRWANSDRVDPAIMQNLMRGNWQAFIPVQGEGSRIIGEVSRAMMPPENFKFDQIAKADLNEEWVTGNIGLQVTSDKSSDEDQNKSNANTQIGRERAKVASFFIGIAEVLGGLLCLYEDPSGFGQGFDPAISKDLRCSILADSTVLLDSNQKLARLNQFINVYAKSGWINVEPVLQEIATLTGLDPSIVVKAPEPKPPVEPNISLRLTGVEDMLNPLALAFLIKSGQAPSNDLIEQAKALIQQAVVPPAGLQMPGSVQPPGGLPMLPEGTPGAPQAPPGAPPAGQAPSGPPLPPPTGASPPGTPLPSPPPPAIGEAHPGWTSMSTINKRTEGNQK